MCSEDFQGKLQVLTKTKKIICRIKEIFSTWNESNSFKRHVSRKYLSLNGDT